jgi:hypothetical protein
MSNSLPASFADLERFVLKWDKPGTNERYSERLASTMTELRDFHAAVRDRLTDIQAHLDPIPFAQYQEQDRRLARLVFAWVPVAEAVEVFKQPRVADSKMYWDVTNEPELT